MKTELFGKLIISSICLPNDTFYSSRLQNLLGFYFRKWIGTAIILEDSVTIPLISTDSLKYDCKLQTFVQS